MALYGCETCPINEAALKDLMGALADLTTFTTSRRSLEMTFDVAASEGQDPDPEIESVCRRVMCFRRNATKKMELDGSQWQT